MKAYHIDRFGSIGGIVRRSAEDPRPGPKEVLMASSARGGAAAAEDCWRGWYRIWIFA